jgi:hypothetical protein
MGDDIEINVTETTNIIEITPQLNDQIVDIAVTDNAPNVELNITPSVIEINVTRGSSTAIWGSITGNIDDQTDLATKFGLKADLVDGKVPSSQLPSYVDDVIEVANYAALPTIGETGKIYITLDNNKVFRWGGSTYIEIAANNAVWGAITGTLSNQTDLQNVLNTKEPTITAGITSQYWRGDKSWQTLDKFAVGLGDVDNTSDVNKPISTATQTALNGKEPTISVGTSSQYYRGDKTWQTLDKTAVGLPNVDNTSDLNKPISTATQTALNGKFNNPTGNTTQYIAGDGSLITFPTILDSGNLVCLVRNQSGATIIAGSLVYISGGSGNKPLISLSQGNNEPNSSRTFGMVRNDISNNSNGYVVISGQVTDLNTSTYAEGTVLYLSPTTAGGFTSTKPSAPNHLVYIGEVIYSHSQHGTIQTRIQNGYELDELHNVALSSLVDKGILTYEFSTSLWKNKSLGTIIGGTSSQFVKGDGTLDSSIYALDSAVVHLTGSETIDGIKTFIGNSLILDPTSSTSSLTFKGSGSLVAEFLFNSMFTQFSSKASNGYLFKNIAGNNTLSITDSGNGTFLGNLTSTAFIKSGGTSSQFLKANGSVDSNSYQIALTNPITGTGTTNYIPKFTGSTTLGNSLIYDNGTNVGIGTTSPTGLLHIFGSSPAFRIQNNGTGNMQFGQWDGSTNRIEGSGRDFNFVANGVYNMLFETGFTERMRITSGGNVGIGTTAPSSKLTVQDGEIKVRTANFVQGSTGTAISIGVDQTGQYGRILVGKTGDSVSANLVLSEFGGNVGIGTTSVSYTHLRAHETG